MDQPGNVLENDEEDNIAYRRLFVDMNAVGTAASSQIASLDRNCVITVPPGGFQEAAVLAVRPLDEREFAAVVGGVSNPDSYDTTPKSSTVGKTGLPGFPHLEGVSKRAPLPGISIYGYKIVTINNVGGGSKPRFL